MVKVGDRVRYVSTFDDYVDDGSVIEVINDDVVKVLWDHVDNFEEMMGMGKIPSLEKIGEEGVTSIE